MALAVRAVDQRVQPRAAIGGIILYHACSSGRGSSEDSPPARDPRRVPLEGCRRTVLYVGKAKRLRSRVRSYFAADRRRRASRRRVLMRQVADLETIVVPTETHALILEANLIKEYRPRFNIALRDDKSYPYIKVTVAGAVSARVRDAAAAERRRRYFGPYTDVGAMRRALNVVKQLFTVRSCRSTCRARCRSAPVSTTTSSAARRRASLRRSQEDYRAMIDEVLVFLEGRTDDVMRRCERRWMPRRSTWTSSGRRSCAMR